jgi:hypothetical protein
MMRGRNEQAWVHHRALAGTQDPALRLLSHCNSFWGAEKAAPRLVVNNGHRIQKFLKHLMLELKAIVAYTKERGAQHN